MIVPVMLPKSRSRDLSFALRTAFGLELGAIPAPIIIFRGDPFFSGLFLELGMQGEFFLFPPPRLGERLPEERRLPSPPFLSDFMLDLRFFSLILGLFPLRDKLVLGEFFLDVLSPDILACFSPVAFST